ncbi:hypothetical protein PPTG_21775 [Phytophthora nicotianae INRA-310]|uniref:Uncharacterized protein n=1 Tax=Phytophthora nicotianae (strain INRA-310) TaxID=761204 RepID=W2QWU8_PHYN3|nr:hypothetical protein PPTG_21775 [Phytophthora nicotianae INRA-310]ETN16745.1 hypothetical protein PPTG_21775 [Phytophthora nicotianae INRA-310]
MEGPYDTRSPNWLHEDYPHLFDGAYGNTPAALAAATTAASALFYFMTRRLWEDITAESETYFFEKMKERERESYDTV